MAVVLLAVDAAAGAVLGAHDPILFTRADVAVTAGAGLAVVHVSLASLQAGCLAVGQRAVLYAIADALLLVDIALDIGLHALRRRAGRVADRAVVRVTRDVLA